MKNKKIIFGIIGIVLLVGVILYTVLTSGQAGTNQNNNSSSLVKEVSSKTNKKYKLKFAGGEILNENTSFRDFAFISNNVIYIYDPAKLENNEVSYHKVYDAQNKINIMNIRPGYGATITFIDDSDTEYTLYDNNLENKIESAYSSFANAKYELSDSLKWTYSTKILGKKIDYDFMSNYVYAQDNKLYAIIYGNERYPQIEPINGNYEGEKVIRIYNERILKTDKAFYEIVKYFDKELNKQVYFTLKINTLTKYYDEVLTFTYRYVILKDYTLIPIKDIIVRTPSYQENTYIISVDSKPTVFEE